MAYLCFSIVRLNKDKDSFIETSGEEDTKDRKKIKIVFLTLSFSVF